MTNFTLGKNNKGIIDMSFDDWSCIYRDERISSDEKIIAIGKLGENNILTLTKKQWSRSFRGIPGLVGVPGSVNGLEKGGDQGGVIHLKDHTVSFLDAKTKSPLCITAVSEKFFVKSFTSREMVSEMPGWVVLDEFQPTQVVRWWSSRPNITAITDALLERMLITAGRLRINPMTAVEGLSNVEILPAKKELLGELLPVDENILANYITELRENQHKNGSWQNSAVITAGNLIRLLQSGIATDDIGVSKGVKWLEHSLEPVGMPGMFLYDEEMGKEYNRRKLTGEPVLDVKPIRWRAYFDKLSREYFSQYMDLLPKYGKSCEPHTTWATALVLQALIRCGRAQSPRVARAIQTLVQYRNHFKGCGGWCGCGVFGTMLVERGIDPEEDVDFNTVKIPVSNKDIEHSTWFMAKNEVQRMICNRYAENHTCLKLGDNLGLLVKNRLSSPISNCTTVIESALALHPDFHNTNLELLCAYEMSNMQNPNGDWPSHKISGMLHFVSLINHPLAKFAAYRSLPTLIRTQKPNGLWFSEEGNNSSDDLLILTALKRLRVLDKLSPM